ncbi:MAG TPA: hypothetical protein VFB34_02905 [Chloroflexota bacterium]|nr:hypothetical protein [Chloroflexota bacterium]
MGRRSDDTRTIRTPRGGNGTGPSLGLIVVACGLILAIVAMFLPWSSAACPAGCPGHILGPSQNGFHNWGALYFFAWLVAALALTGEMLTGNRVFRGLVLDDWVLYLIAGLLMVAALLFYYFGANLGSTIAGIRLNVQYGWILAMVGAGLVVIGALLTQNRLRLTAVPLVEAD